MDFYKRPQPNTRRWLWLICAFAGTLLLAFVPGTAWLNLPESSDPLLLLFVCALKQLLTAALLLIVPALIAHAAHTNGLFVLPLIGFAAFGFAYLLTRDLTSALCTLLLIALPGVGLFVLQKRKLSNFRTVLGLSALTLFALFGYLCLKDLIENGNAYLPFKQVVLLYERMVKGIETYFSPNDAYFQAIADLIAEAKLTSEAIGLPALVIPAMCAGLSNVLFSHLFNRGGDADLAELPPFSEWRCERMFVYIATGFALLTYILALLNVNGMDTLASIALLVWRLPCGLAGLSAVRRLSLRTHKTWIFIIICCAAFTLSTFGLTMLSLLGMIASIGNRMNDRKDGTLQ